MATIDPPRSIRIKTSTGWADLALAGAPGTPGYPPTTGKLSNVLTVSTAGAAPTWQPPAPSGSQITYKGDWVAGNYNDGDVVVYNGVEYMAARATSAAPVPWPAPPGGGVPLPVVNGQWLKGVGGSAVWAPLVPSDLAALVSYGTTFPASPVDGQEAVLVDNVANPSFQWRFRYNAGSTSAYKWEYFGGGGACSGPQGHQDFTSTAWTGFGGGPAVTAPRAGEYILEWGCVVNNNNTVTWSGVYVIYAGVFAGATQVGVNAEYRPTGAYGGGNISSVMNVTLALGDGITIGVMNQIAQGSTVERGYIWMIPKRVS